MCEREYLNPIIVGVFLFLFILQSNDYRCEMELENNIRECCRETVFLWTLGQHRERMWRGWGLCSDSSHSHRKLGLGVVLLKNLQFPNLLSESMVEGLET